MRACSITLKLQFAIWKFEQMKISCLVGSRNTSFFYAHNVFWIYGKIFPEQTRNCRKCRKMKQVIYCELLEEQAIITRYYSLHQAACSEVKRITIFSSFLLTSGKIHISSNNFSESYKPHQIKIHVSVRYILISELLRCDKIKNVSS